MPSYLEVSPRRTFEFEASASDEEVEEECGGPNLEISNRTVEFQKNCSTVIVQNSNFGNKKEQSS